MQVSAVKELTRGNHDMLVEALRRIFGEFDEDMLAKVLPRLEWVELAGGERLFNQGEHDDSLYFVISGRLRASRQVDGGVPAVLGDIARGETVGELAFFTGEARMASITAVRDCMLARFSSTAFREVLTAYPLIAMNITRLVIERMQRPVVRKNAVKPVTLCLAAITAGVDAEDFAHRLVAVMSESRKTAVVTAAQLGEWLGDAGAAQTPRGDGERSRRLAYQLEKLEAEHEYVLLVADAGPTEWTRRCLRHCDEVLLLADAQQPPGLSAIEAECLAGGEASRAASTLVLMHPPQVRTPSGTSRWLHGRQVSRHIHLRPALQADWTRAGRMVSGNAVGLVLSGGGARGFAHLGIMKALAEAGIAYDMAGGTSIGAVMALFAAADLPVDEAIARARRAFKVNPTGDFNLVPMMSLIGGKRLRQVIDSGVDDLMGSGSCIEDTWKSYFCISSNYTLAQECALTRGPLARSVRASLSIPGALPPVLIDGELHIDGGTFNNFPTDVMATLGAARIIGVNLLREGGLKTYEMEELPGNSRLLFDKLRGKRHKLPGLMPLLLNTSIMYSYARQGESRRLCDLYFAPGVHRYGMLEWSGFDDIVEAGYRYAQNELQTSGNAAKFLGVQAAPAAWHLSTLGPGELVPAA